MMTSRTYLMWSTAFLIEKIFFYCNSHTLEVHIQFTHTQFTETKRYALFVIFFLYIFFVSANKFSDRFACASARKWIVRVFGRNSTTRLLTNELFLRHECNVERWRNATSKQKLSNLNVKQQTQHEVQQKQKIRIYT